MPGTRPRNGCALLSVPGRESGASSPWPEDQEEPRPSARPRSPAGRSKASHFTALAGTPPFPIGATTTEYDSLSQGCQPRRRHPRCLNRRFLTRCILHLYPPSDRLNDVPGIRDPRLGALTMKQMLVAMAAVLLMAASAFAQAQPQTQQAQDQSQLLGRGRGGTPFAWNDRNQDGICDVTGQPVGQGSPIGFGRGRGRAGAASSAGSPVRAGRGGGRWWNQAPQAQP
jgi:hypothetical protein